MDSSDRRMDSGDDEPEAPSALVQPRPSPTLPLLGNRSNALHINPLEQSKKSERFAFVAYYGYRYYDPATGRWPSRDPIGELGFQNDVININKNTTNNFLKDWSIGVSDKLKKSSENVTSYVLSYLLSDEETLIPAYLFANSNPILNYDIYGLAVVATDEQSCYWTDVRAPDDGAFFDTVQVLNHKRDRRTNPASTVIWKDPCPDPYYLADIDVTKQPTAGSGGLREIGGALWNPARGDIYMSIESRYSLFNSLADAKRDTAAKFKCCCSKSRLSTTTP